MAVAGGEVLRIASEADAWKALRWLLENRRAAANASIELVDLSWGHVNVTYRGEVFHQTVTASIMRGLVEYQNDLYRAFARVTKDDGRVTKLTDAEKADLELVFKVNEGSSDFWAEAASLMGALSKAVEKLTGRQALIAILVLILLTFGTVGVGMYFQYTVDLKKIEAEEKGRQYDIEEKKDLYELLQKLTDKDAAATIDSALKASPVAADISDYVRHGYDEIIRSADSVDELVLQSTTVSASVIQEIRKSSRATSEAVTITDTNFYVTGVDSEDTSAFIVHLLSEDGELDLVAALEDPLASSRYAKAIQNAEWTGKPVRVHITGRRVGPIIKDAVIVKAFTPRVRTA